MSGATLEEPQETDPASLSPQPLAEEVREKAGVATGEGPTDRNIEAAVEGFAHQFHYWYTRVMANAVHDYRRLIVARINPFVRQVEFQGQSAEAVSERLVLDYSNRNFVTAGGWAIEKMAIALGSNNAKAAAEGIDLHRIDPETGDQHLYVIKSGTVTRNSDILKALKTHAQKAEKLINQGGGKNRVFANYAVATCATSSTYHDYIFRPSSAQFWSEISDLEPSKALDLVREIARAAGRVIKMDSKPHTDAIRLLTATYIETEPGSNEVDWVFIFDRNMRERSSWASEDEARHKRARDALKATGYTLLKRVKG
jgi:hypothetical protein